MPFSKKHVSFQLPELVHADVITYRKNSAEKLSSSDLISRALNQPFSSPPLVEIAKGKQNSVILISDLTRLVPSYLFLGDLICELNKAGIPDAKIKIIVALGLHRKQTKQELIELVGISIFQRVQVSNHSALPEDCLYVGTTPQGTRIEINRDAVEADLLIATGNIKPHGLVGMSGGVKALFPGVASGRSIEQNHSLSQKHKVSPGNINNVIHQDLEAVLSFVPIHFLFNVIVDHNKEIMDAVAGDVIEAHKIGVEKAKQRFIIPVSVSYDVVIASAGGHPDDIHLYQAIKTLQNAEKITKPGGKIVLIARCEEIFGNGLFQYWVDTIQDREKMAQKLKEQFVIGAHKVGHINKVLKKFTVYLYSDIPASIVELVGFQPITDLQSTITKLVSDPSVKTAIMPYGGLTFFD